MNTLNIGVSEEEQRFHKLQITSVNEDCSQSPALGFQAEFRISTDESELPDFDLLVISLYLWHERTRLEHYDQAAGVGRFTADEVEGLPQVGDVIQAPVLEVEQDDDEPFCGPLRMMQTPAFCEEDEVLF